LDGAGALLKAVDGVYGAAMAPEQWPSTIETITDLLNSDHAMMAVYGAANRVVFASGARVDPCNAARACSAEATQLAAPWSRGFPVNDVAWTGSIFPTPEFERSAYYNEVVRPMNGFFAFGAHIRRSEVAAHIAVCRPRGADAPTGTELTVARALLPHLANALQIQFQLRTSDQRGGGAVQLLDRLDAGVILTDEAMRPCFLNRRAEQIVAEADGLVLAGQRLGAATLTETCALRRAVATAGAPDETDDALRDPGKPVPVRPPVRMRLTRPSMRPPLALTLLPVWRVGMQVPGTRAPRVAIWITEPDARAPIDPAAVAEVFQLTPREATVATLIASGFDLNGAAALLGIRSITARNHLTNAFEKTGAHSQAALVALIRGLADPFASSNGSG